MGKELDKIVIDGAVKQVLLGSLLGDGCLPNDVTSKNVRYSEHHCLKQKNYLSWKRKILAKEFRFGKSSYSEGRKIVGIRSCVDPRLTIIRTIFYPNNKRIVTNEVLRQMGPLALAVWYCDDGTYHWQTHSCKIYSSFPYGEHLLIQRCFKNKWNIESKTYKSRENFHLKLDAKETRKFLEIIQPAFYQYKIPKCMWYKLGHSYKANKPIINLVLAKKRQSSKKRYQKPEVRQQKRDYYLKNREKILEQRKKHSRKPEVRKRRKIYMREYCRKHQQKNRDRINKYKREWRRKRKEMKK